MTIRQIDIINEVVRKNRNSHDYSINRPNWCGCFIGNFAEWKYFLKKNKENIAYGIKYRINLQNGERWTWVPEGTKAYDVSRYDRVIVPRRISFDYMHNFFCTVGLYCTEIEWYGLPDED